MSLHGRGRIISQTSLTWRNLTMCKWGLKRIKASPGLWNAHLCLSFVTVHHSSKSSLNPREHRFLGIGNGHVHQANCGHCYTATFRSVVFRHGNQEVQALTPESLPAWHGIPFPWSSCNCLADEQTRWVMDTEEGQRTDWHSEALSLFTWLLYWCVSFWQSLTPSLTLQQFQWNISWIINDSESAMQQSLLVLGFYCVCVISLIDYHTIYYCKCDTDKNKENSRERKYTINTQ